MPLTTDTNWIIGFCCRLGNYLLLALTLAWAKMDLFLEGTIIRQIYVFCICVGVNVFVCHVVQKYRRKTWMTKTQWGLHASLCGVELMQRHYPFLFLLASPILYKGIKKNSARRGAIGEEHKAWQSHSHRPLIHNSINVENLFLRCPARAQREVCWWAQKKPLLPSVTEIWMSIRVCVTIWTFAFICS